MKTWRRQHRRKYCQGVICGLVLRLEKHLQSISSTTINSINGIGLCSARYSGISTRRYPAPTAVRAASSILERNELCAHTPAPQRYYIVIRVNRGDRAMQRLRTRYDEGDIYIHSAKRRKRKKPKTKLETWGD